MAYIKKSEVTAAVPLAKIATTTELKNANIS